MYNFCLARLLLSSIKLLLHLFVLAMDCEIGGEEVYMQLEYDRCPAHSYGPPAMIPAPIMLPEYATCNCVAKNAPDEIPDVETSLGSTL